MNESIYVCFTHITQQFFCRFFDLNRYEGFGLLA